MGQRSVRFPDDLEAKVQARADALERSFSWVALKAIEQASRDWDEPEPPVRPHPSPEIAEPLRGKIKPASSVPPPQFNRAKRLG